MTLKDTHGKPKLELLKKRPLEAVAKVREFGINKYQNDQDWQFNSVECYLGAALRHIYSHLDGDEYDLESGMPHLAHSMTDLMLAIELFYEHNISECN
jgi:hypothetical protein